MNSPLTWTLGFLAVMAGIFILRAWFGYRTVERDALADYDYKSGNDMIPAGLSKEAYIDVYRRVNNPRDQAYMGGALALILVATPVLFYLLEWVLRMIYNYSGQSRVIEPGYLVWQFLLFFMVIGCWVAIGYVAAQRYHRRKPGPLHYEIEQALKTS